MGVVVGIISDTHGTLDERALKLFSENKVALIFHAGDIGPASILHELECVAPVVAVLGNNDRYTNGLNLEHSITRTVAGNRIYMVHDLAHASLDSTLDVAIFGHTHRPLVARDPMLNILTINPGSASRPRNARGKSVALLKLDGPHNPHAEIIYL